MGSSTSICGLKKCKIADSNTEDSYQIKMLEIKQTFRNIRLPARVLHIPYIQRDIGMYIDNVCMCK